MVILVKIYAGIVNFKFKDYEAAVEDLSACVEVDDQNKSAYTYLVRIQDLKSFWMMKLIYLYTKVSVAWQGLALSSVGDYKKAEEAHTKAIQIDKSFLEAWTHLTQVSINILMDRHTLSSCACA